MAFRMFAVTFPDHVHGYVQAIHSTKGNHMKPLHLERHIFNSDAIIMIEPYYDGGFVHCIDNHTYELPEAEYKQLLELLGKE